MEPLSPLLLLLILLPFLGAVIAACMPAHARNAEAWLAGGVVLGGLLILMLLYPSIADRKSVV